MGKAPKPPKAPPPPPPPVQEVDAEGAGVAEKQFLKGRKGAMSSWLTKGQSLGGGAQLK